MAEMTERTKNKDFLSSLGVALIALGVLLAIFGVLGLISPHTCPGIVPGCIVNPTPVQLAATYLGFSLIAAGAVSFVAAKYHGHQHHPRA